MLLPAPDHIVSDGVEVIVAVIIVSSLLFALVAMLFESLPITSVIAAHMVIFLLSNLVGMPYQISIDVLLTTFLALICVKILGKTFSGFDHRHKFGRITLAILGYCCVIVADAFLLAREEYSQRGYQEDEFVPQNHILAYFIIIGLPLFVFAP